MDAWPALPLAAWEPTYKTVHRFSQIVGKIALAHCPPIPHWWHSTLRFGAVGLETLPMPISGGRQLQLQLDFVDHILRFSTSGGERRSLPLAGHTVAEFYREVLDTLDDLGASTAIWPVPVEVAEVVPFPEDLANGSYDRPSVETMWRILSSMAAVFREVRGGFLGKSSPVHFFWGAFDLAVTRFSGERNPDPPTDPVMREAYSHAVISHGFWFGGDWPTGGRYEEPVLYGYALPQPAGFERAAVKPDSARWQAELGEFVLPYEAVRQAEDPAARIREFLDSTYAAAADLAGWDRQGLERGAQEP